MDFTLAEEQEMLRKMARDFLEKECPESFVREMEKDDKGYSPELWRQIAELGWLRVVFPEKYGGAGGSVLDMAVLFEEMGRVMFPSPALSSVVLGGLTVLAAGSEEQKSEFIPKIADGDLILALALTEPSASWNADGVAVKAVADGDEYVIDGTKLFVPDAHVADYLLCVAKTGDGAAPEEGLTLFLVDAKSQGLQQTLLKTVAGDRQSEVVFSGVRVPGENMVGELNGGWLPLVSALQQGTVMLCAAMIGAGQRVLELTLDYAKTRVQFDQPIGVNQYVQDYCINMFSAVESTRFLTYQAAWRLSEGLASDVAVAMAKARASDAIDDACLCAQAVFASMGYATEDSVLPLYTKRVKAAQLYLGDASHHRSIIAKHLEASSLEMPQGKALGLWEEGGS